MNISQLEDLLNPQQYFSFLKSLIKHRDRIEDVNTWLEWYKGDENKLQNILERIGKILMEKHYEVLYPIELIPVPRYPFTKRPIIAWSELQDKPFSDFEVNKLKYICGKLGNLINAGFITRHIIVIDVEHKDSFLRKIADVETRRGFHIIRYLDKYECVELRVGESSKEVSGLKISFVKNSIHIDVFSGKYYLASHPLQSRWLEYDGKVINVRSYKIVSNEAYYSFRSADFTPLKASPSEIEDLLKTILKQYGFDYEARTLKVIPLEKTPTVSGNLDTGAGTPKKESHYNTKFYSKLSPFNYNEFKEMLLKVSNLLPTCLKNALFSNIPKGVRFFHGCLLRCIVPHFVFLDDKNLQALINDWYSRCGRTKSDLTRAKYLWIYYTGKLTIDNVKVRAPSFMNVPSEAWSTFMTLGYCNNCLIKDTCLTLKPRERKKMLIKYIEDLIVNVCQVH